MSTIQPVTENNPRFQSENRVFYPALDGLRAIAFFMVFLQHYMYIPWGNSGVNLFFVLSGFLITGILWDTRDSPHRARNFYIRRTLRIFPLYYGIFLVLLLLTPLLHWQWSKYWMAWPLYLGNYLRFFNPSAAQSGSVLQLAADAGLFLGRSATGGHINLGHFWSLCVEEQFYLLWPWVVFSIPSRRALLWLSSIVVLVLPFLRFFMQPHLSAWLLKEEIFYRLTPFELDSLLLGAVLALLWRSPSRQRMLSFAQRITPFALLVCAAAYVWTARHSPDAFGEFRFPTWRWTFGLSLTNALSAILIVCALRPETWVYRAMSVSWIRSVGRISYGAYIFHDIYDSRAHDIFRNAFPVFVHTHRFASGLFVAVPCLIVTLLLASLSFRFFESPFLNLKEKFSR